MGERIRPLIDAAKQLSPEDREELLEAILQLDSEFVPDPAHMDDWNARFEDIQAGRVETIDADEAIATARRDLKARRPG